MEKLRVFTAFSGYDSQCLGLERLKENFPEFDYELVGWSEIDKNAIKAHNALFPQWTDRNYGDISKIDWNQVPDFDLFTYSSPCQDFSSAGLQKGGTEGAGTRSSLLWECRRCIEEKRPKYTLFENVQALLQKKFKDVFNKWISTVNNYGYQSSYQILNSSDFGIPQNRARIFMVSVRNDVNMTYKFPGPLNKCPHLYEILEQDSDVDPKYTRKPSRLKHYLELNAEDMAYLDSPVNSNDKYDVIPCGVYCHCTDPFNAPPLFDCSRTLKAESIESGIIYKQNGKWHMRLFTPHECFRLMGLTDEEYEKINQVVPQTGQSKCAGNSIVVNVLYHIFRRMFIDIDVPDRGTQNVLF
jgi:DNA (cytosine-5)-methyltransferase 1